MLTGSEIKKRQENGSIIIEPFNLNQLNPNSYNLRLGNKLKVYDIQKTQIMDCKKPTRTRDIEIPEEGYILRPGTLYLGETAEIAGATDCIPCIDGRSSVARNGISLHVTAGFGDIGFIGKWTLEITVVHPIIVYPNMEIGQVYFYDPIGEIGQIYEGKYQNQDGAVASKIHEDFDILNEEDNQKPNMDVTFGLFNNFFNIEAKPSLYNITTTVSFKDMMLDVINNSIVYLDSSVDILHIVVFASDEKILDELRDTVKELQSVVKCTLHAVHAPDEIEGETFELFLKYNDINNSRSFIFMQDKHLLSTNIEGLDVEKFFKSIAMRNDLKVFTHEQSEYNYISESDVDVDMTYGFNEAISQVSDRIAHNEAKGESIKSQLLEAIKNIGIDDLDVEIIEAGNIEEVAKALKNRIKQSLDEKEGGYVIPHIIYENLPFIDGVTKSVIDTCALYQASKIQYDNLGILKVNGDVNVLILSRPEFELGFIKKALIETVQNRGINLIFDNLDPSKSLEEIYENNTKEHDRIVFVTIINDIPDNDHFDGLKSICTEMQDFSKKHLTIINVITETQMNRNDIIDELKETNIDLLLLINDNELNEKINLNEIEE